jgi:hypothetical protein
MLKGKDKVKSDVETETRDGHPFDSERFKSQIEFILEIDKLNCWIVPVRKIQPNTPGISP